MIAVSRLLKSCAMPPARRPTASIFCEWRSCSSSSSRLVIASSRSAMIAASSRPLSEPSARNMNSRNCVNSTGNVAERTDAHAGDRDGERRRSAPRCVVAPRAPNRRPAQPTIGKNTNAIGTSRVANRPHSPNISCDADEQRQQQRDAFADARPRPRRSAGRRPRRRSAAPSPSRRASRAATTA